VLLFLDWPTKTMDRYYALPPAERQDYVRVALAEAYATGEWFALPLATTTDANTATALGMLGFFQSLRAFYGRHAALLRDAAPAQVEVTVSAPHVSAWSTSLPDGREVIHLVNHNYAAGFVRQAGVTVVVARDHAPRATTIASPDLAADVKPRFRYSDGRVTVEVGTLTSSAMVVVE
jgi:hypothetical protein